MEHLLNRRTVLAGLAAASCTPLVGEGAEAQVRSDFSHLPPDRKAEAESMFARMMAAFPFDRTVIGGANAADEWSRLKGIDERWPVVVGDDEALERLAEQYSMDDPAVFGALPGLPPVRAPSDILEQAVAIEFPKDLTKWPGAYQPGDLQAEIGPWPDIPAGQAMEFPLSVSLDLVAGQPFERVHVLLLPTRNSWEVPAYLRWGGWNACPPPEYHVAALHHWHQAYGAELAGICGDRMDLWVPRPPSSRADALSVAKDVYGYCPDLVDQGTLTVATLAATMVTSHWWTFWWD